MADIQLKTSSLLPTTPSHRSKPVSLRPPPLLPTPLMTPPSYQGGHLNIDVLSPVDQNGSFCFDRVIRRGRVNRRIKKKGAWKPSWKHAYLVLRPNLLSIYKDEEETDLRASITLSDVTAVAPVKKTHTDHVFGVFSPAKNYHFQGISEKDSAEWISEIRMETRTEAEAEELDAPDPYFSQSVVNATGYETTDLSADDSPIASGSPDGGKQMIGSRKRPNLQAKSSTRRASALEGYSGNEQMTTSHSDFSDVQAGSLPKSFSSSLPKPTLAPITSSQKLRPPVGMRNSSQLSIGQQEQNADPERVIRQGWLLVLRTKGGVKSWKSLWAVLRQKTLSFYKNEQEYSAVKILPMNSVIDAAEIDPVSKSKVYCFQIIIEDTTYKICASDEEGLAKWLGALKSVLTKRHQGDRHKNLVDAASALSIR